MTITLSGIFDNRGMIYWLTTEDGLIDIPKAVYDVVKGMERQIEILQDKLDYLENRFDLEEESAREEE